MEHSQIIVLQSTSDRVHQAAVVEKNEIVLAPVVRVNELVVFCQTAEKRWDSCTHVRCNTRALDLEQDVSHSPEIRDVRTVGVQSTLTVCASWERVDQQFVSDTGVDLEVQFSSHFVLPELYPDDFSNTSSSS